MKKIQVLVLLITAVCTIGMTSCKTHKQVAKLKRPSAEQIESALDSICTEGYNLYIAERVNWVATDSVLAHYSADSLGNNIIWQVSDSVWNVVFFDRERENCIFELNYNVNSEKQAVSYDARPIAENERKLWEMKYKMLANVIGQYSDSLGFNHSYGNPNIDFVRIDANTTRMYILQGVERPNIIPFGNDYSIDFDNEGIITAFRRYHKSFIPLPTVNEDGSKVKTTYHSHLKDNPYITPTDICNFLLYRGDMKQTYVLSTALDGYVIYDAENNRAVFVAREVMEKISKHQHYRLGKRREKIIK